MENSKFGIKKQVLEEIIQLAETHNVDKLILFGSRARGDYRERSDIDLAFSGGNAAEFMLDVNEDTSTLLQFDLVDLKGPVQPELLSSIEKEGVLIYEKI